MKIIRPEEATSIPEFGELTPEELEEAYALAKAAFTAEDLQRYMELDEGVPMEQILTELEEIQKQPDPEKRGPITSQRNGQPITYQVHGSEQTSSIWKRWQGQASQSGLGEPFLSALRVIEERLRTDPLTFGERQYQLPALQLLVCQSVVKPLVVDYAVHEEKRLVFIRGFKFLSSALTGFSHPAAPVPKTGLKIVRLEELQGFPEIRELTPEELKEAYALAKAAFTAEDLQRYTELDEGVPIEQVLAELEEIQKKFGQEKKAP